MTGIVTRQKNSFRVVLSLELIMKSVASKFLSMISSQSAGPRL
jgi:NADH:ubiquinone oxidoreductase subunit K